jgi:hypothetical protein
MALTEAELAKWRTAMAAVSRRPREDREREERLREAAADELVKQHFGWGEKETSDATK